MLGVDVNGDRCPVGIDPALQFCARDARDGHLKYFGQSVRAVSTRDRVERQERTALRRRYRCECTCGCACTIHPCDRRPQTTQRRNIAPPSHDTA